MQNLITLTELKTYLGISTSDDDAKLNAIIAAASNYIEKATGRQFYAVDYSENPLKIDGNGKHDITIPDFLRIDKVEIYNEGSTTPSTTLLVAALGVDWWYSPGNYAQMGLPMQILTSDYEFIAGRWTVRIYGIAGYSSTTPEPVKQAVKELCSLTYNRANKEDIAQETIGRTSFSYNIDSAAVESKNVMHLIAPYRDIRF